MADRFPHKTEEFDTTGEDSGVSQDTAGEKVIRTRDAMLYGVLCEILDEIKQVKQLLEGVL